MKSTLRVLRKYGVEKHGYDSTKMLLLNEQHNAHNYKTIK